MLTTEAQDYGRRKQFIEPSGGGNASPRSQTYPHRPRFSKTKGKAFFTDFSLNSPETGIAPLLGR